MDWRELAKQIDDKCNFEKISQKPLNEAEKKEWLYLWQELEKVKNLTADEHREFLKICPYFESFCIIAGGIEWEQERKKNI